MNYTKPFLRKVETAQEEQQQHQHPQHQSGVSYRAAVAANNKGGDILVTLQTKYFKENCP